MKNATKIIKYSFLFLLSLCFANNSFGMKRSRSSENPTKRRKTSERTFISSSTTTLNAVGLNNLGNTCYANSALQLIFSITPITKTLIANYNKYEDLIPVIISSCQTILDHIETLNPANPETTNLGNKELKEAIKIIALIRNDQNLLENLANNNELMISAQLIQNKLLYMDLPKAIAIINELAKLADELSKENTFASINPHCFIETALPLLVPNYQEYSQEDSSAVVTRLLDYIILIHPELEYLFNFELNQNIKCSKCKKTVCKTEKAFSLDLGIPKKKKLNINNCLYEFFRTETLAGENQYYCQKCDSKQNAKKQSKITNPSPYLIITLKRFNNGLGKIKTPVAFPLLDFNIANCRQNPKITKYNLLGFILHSGSFKNGHYISAMQKDDGWYTFNDNKINKQEDRTINMICNNGQLKARKHFNSFDPYVIIYKNQNVNLENFEPRMLPSSDALKILVRINKIVLYMQNSKNYSFFNSIKKIFQFNLFR